MKGRSKEGQGSNKKGTPDFEARLGARSGSTPWEVNYDTLLQAKAHQGKVPVRKQENILDDAPVSWYPLSLTSSTIKQYDGTPFECEFNPDEAAHLRKNFLDEPDSEYFLGFEMFHALFKKDKSLKSFTFPLYYLKVRLKQAHRMLYIEPTEQGRFYLNHLALACLLETFSGSTSKDVLPRFFKSLLTQHIELRGKISRIYLSRTLPVHEDIFSKSREIFLGAPGEEGKGGILSELKVSGIECDVDDACLYKSKQHLSMVSGLLEQDLHQILRIATEDSPKFDSSLLGQFLNASYSPPEQKTDNLPASWMPGALPQSMKNLRKNLSRHDLLVLEGPPGTGKTHTIRNLVIDAICASKKILVVSDRASAVEALEDKLNEYFTDLCEDDSEQEQIKNLWPSVLPTIYDYPEDTSDIKVLISAVKKALRTGQEAAPLQRPETGKSPAARLKETDADIASHKAKLQELLELQLNTDEMTVAGSASRRGQPSSRQNIEHLLDFLNFINQKQNHHGGVLRVSGAKTGEDFVSLRDTLRQKPWRDFYRYFEMPGRGQHWPQKDLERALTVIAAAKPKTKEELAQTLEEVAGDSLVKSFAALHDYVEPPDQSGIKNLFLKIRNLLGFPLKKSVRFLENGLARHRKFLKSIEPHPPGVLKEFSKIHEFLDPHQEKVSFPVSLELALFRIAQKNQFKDKKAQTAGLSAQKILQKIDSLQEKRDKIVGEQVILRLNEIAENLSSTRKGDQTPRRTRINFLSTQLSETPEHPPQSGVLPQLQEALAEAFPVWFCRKQLVPLLLPCVERSIDLIIVDEATQCRVDDALPLLMRAGKLMAVGNDKQTVLSKKSAIDDYLFQEFNLREHLASTQATGIKGGGSHIFGLLKNIHQASILLDKHYRCPPDIIAYSNRYVYGSQLKIMQWKKPGDSQAVSVDYREKEEKSSPKPASGPFKGIETAMIDRFLVYMEEEIIKAEKQMGRKIDVERDVAICYFLLKNKVYFESIKSKFLSKLKRGTEILNGAGAELQGKERDLIFYFWDCQKTNFGVFRQGDDEHKRKGELNVLMSRPKKRAYHYIHKNFEHLAHDQSSITDYLWGHLQNHNEPSQSRTLKKRLSEPEHSHPLNRGSGQLILAFISHLCSVPGGEDTQKALRKLYQTAYSVEIGNPEHKADLVLIPKGTSNRQPALAIKDLSHFTFSAHVAEEVCDYYFQLKRANPKVHPVLCFLHDLIEKDGTTLNAVMKWFALKEP